MRAIFSIAFVLALSACSKTEESYHLYDSHMYARFVEQLDHEGVEYRKAENFTVFFPIEEGSKVEEIADSVIAEFITGCGGKFEDPGIQTVLELELKKRNIPFRHVERDGGSWIVCATQYRQEFVSAFQAALRGNSSD